MERPLANSYWVLPGRLLAGEYPYGSTLLRIRVRLRRLLDAGFNSFIDLTQPGEMPDYQSLLPAGVDYLRSPIDDATTPADFEQMHAIQAQLQAALAAGRCIYVHCRAGIGRTGTVVGCYLAQQSLDGEQALTQLNRLWQQSARSASWPRVPQTSEQADFVRAWPSNYQASAQAPAMAAVRALRARFLGSLLGLAMGDALGVATQFRRQGSFAPIGDLIGGGSFDLARGDWSDDTAMALCLAESLLESPGFSVEDQLQRYVRWQHFGHLAASRQCVGISATTARILGRAASDLTAAPPSMHGGSTECAPLSRVGPVVLYYFADQAQAIAQAQAAARVFEAVPVVLDACRLLAAMLHAALRGEPVARIVRLPLRLFSAQPLLPAVLALHALDPMQPPSPQAEPALSVLAAARWALASGGSFRAGALRAANLGGDADVIGAVHGQLAGAVYGHAAIPVGWLAALAERRLIEDMADRLLTGALVGLAESAV